MQKCYVLSRCLKKRELSSEYVFHFKGVYLGEMINSIHVKAKERLVVGSDYFLELDVLQVTEGVLKADLIRLKNLDILTDV